VTFPIVELMNICQDFNAHVCKYETSTNGLTAICALGQEREVKYRKLKAEVLKDAGP